MALVIRRLTESDERAFLDAIERTKESDPNFAFSYKTTMSFREYLEVLRRREAGIDLPPNYVPDTLLFGFVGQEIVGRVSIRHRLNDHLLKVGGHIGYVVVPQFRGRRYGTELCRYALEFARGMGLEKVLITCDDNNAASIRIIEKCGGQLENVYDGPETKVPKRRYWIRLGDK